MNKAMNEKDSRKKIQELYDKRITSSRNSIIAAGQWGSKEYVPLICEEIGNKIGLTKNDKVIELGCGSGVLGNWLKNSFEFYVGVDISLHMLKFFLDESKGKKPLLIQTTTNTIPLSDNFFDIAILNGVTMYLHDNKILENTFNEMKRVVKKDGTIFIGENIIPSNYFWELSWFQKLSPFSQSLAKPYIRFRRWLAGKNSKLAGKWNSVHRDISPTLIRKSFQNYEIVQSKSAAYTIKLKNLGSKYRGNRRVDFIIKLGKRKNV